MNGNYFPLSFQWHNSIDEINKAEWNQIFAGNILKSFEFFKAQCDADIENTQFMFLVVKWDNKTLAIVPSFTYRLKLDIIASTTVRKFSETVKKRFPNFLSIKIFGVGSLASTCEQHIGIVNNLDNATYQSVCQIISEQIKQKSKELKIKLVFVKEAPQSELQNIKMILQSDYYFYDSLPTNMIPLFTEVMPYPSGLRRKERYRYRDLESKFEKNTTGKKLLIFLN